MTCVNGIFFGSDPSHFSLVLVSQILCWPKHLHHDLPEPTACSSISSAITTIPAATLNQKNSLIAIKLQHRNLSKGLFEVGHCVTNPVLTILSCNVTATLLKMTRQCYMVLTVWTLHISLGLWKTLFNWVQQWQVHHAVLRVLVKWHGCPWSCEQTRNPRIWREATNSWQRS